MVQGSGFSKAFGVPEKVARANLLNLASISRVYSFRRRSRWQQTCRTPDMSERERERGAWSVKALCLMQRQRLTSLTTMAQSALAFTGE